MTKLSNNNIPDDLCVGRQIQLKSGKSWSRNILQVTEIQPGEFIKAENLPGGLTIKVQMPFTQYGISWRLYNPLAGYKVGDAWEAIKNLNDWSEFSDARQTLNYRYHNSFKNPLNKEWHHIHERCAGGANSVENLAVTDTINNQNFNQWFAKPQIGTSGVSVRLFLKKASAKEHREWGCKAIQAYELKLIKRDLGRGLFQEIV
ncbi:hypothetical protein DSM106972_014630 [Dulcicalothrix desertica PCC 7102]|uniref:Uncharacterized protein n=1 Tax=Dulcicalothrix desertica PCC 7102 TaxID=232991 RepID=A0A433VQI0_9CYAN|nr:hypothetical protein [Dulcicalothrix desertica]RUT08295.1 hypothetical protein DSM106972_014630 [Dulcicalothrix desertica PCC 7102]TWH40161.1 hypothetical protein CAL7102_09462 [Dulcicalothrix desertica PCC 7102]